MELNLDKVFSLCSASGIHPRIKNIIFDFGGVILNINLKLMEQAFTRLGLKKTEHGPSLAASTHLFESLETGEISSAQFRDKLRPFFTMPVSDEQLDGAWNAMLLNIPEERIRLLESLRKNYRIFLLSNTNEIHYKKYLSDFRNCYGYSSFEAIFEKVYLSYQLGLSKPSSEIFRYVLGDSQLNPSETLFIDDTLRHVKGAENTGIHAYHLDLSRGEDITYLFH